MMALIKICLLFALITENIAEITIEELPHKIDDLSTAMDGLNNNLTKIQLVLEEKIINLIKAETQLKHKQSLLETKLYNVEKNNQKLLDALNQAMDQINQMNKKEEKLEKKFDLFLETNKKLESNQQSNKNNIEEINDKLVFLTESNKKINEYLKNKDYEDNLLREETKVSFNTVKNLTSNIKIIEKVQSKLLYDQQHINRSFGGIISRHDYLSKQQTALFETLKHGENISNQIEKKIIANNHKHNNLSTFVNKMSINLASNMDTLSERFNKEINTTKINNFLLRNLSKMETEVMNNFMTLSGQLNKEINGLKKNLDELLTLFFNKKKIIMKNMTSLYSEIRLKTDKILVEMNYQNLSNFVNFTNMNKTMEIKLKEIKDNAIELTQKVKSELTSTINLLIEQINQNKNEIHMMYSMPKTINNSITKLASQIKNLIKNISEEIYKLNSKQNNLTQLLNYNIINATHIDQIDRKFDNVNQSCWMLSGHINKTRNGIMFLSKGIDATFQKFNINISEHIKKVFEIEKSNMNKTLQQLQKEISIIKLNQKEQNQNLNQVKIMQSTISEQIEAFNQNNLPELTIKATHIEKSNNNLLFEHLHKELLELKLKQAYLLTKINNSETCVSNTIAMMTKFEDFKNKSSLNNYFFRLKNLKLSNSINAIYKKINESSTSILFETNGKIAILKELLEKRDKAFEGIFAKRD